MRRGIAVRAVSVVLLLVAPNRAAVAAPRTLLGVEPGTQVKVEGRLARSGGLTVERVRARDGDGQVRVESQIAAIEADGRRLKLLDFVIDVPATARVMDGETRLPGPSGLRVGDRVEVRGTTTGPNGITANRIRRSPRIGSPRDEIEAPLGRIVDGKTFEVLGRTMQLARGARFADERSNRPKGTALRRDDDEQQIEAIRLGDWGVVGGRFETTLADRRNIDLDGARDRQSELQSVLRTEVSARVGQRALAYAKVDTTGGYALQPSTRLPTDVQVKEANLLLSVAGPVTVQAGRVRVRDPFEWFADDYVDAARVVVSTKRTSAEAGLSYGLVAPAAGRSRSDERQLFGSISHEFSRALTVAVRALARDDRTRHEQPRWAFVQLSGRLGSARYWSNAAMRGGRSSALAFKGWAYDAGASMPVGARGPVATLGYAVASGDTDRSDSIDRTFRQTGLEDTETRLAGFKRLHTYGALLEPDLSNLRVTTLGLGRQWASAAVDVVHHAYRQDVPRRTPASSSLGLRPDGTRGWLGQEIDGLVTVRTSNGLDLSVLAGVYLPGPAQAAPARPAFFVRPQVQWFF